MLVLSLEEYEAWLPTSGRHQVLAAGGGSVRAERDGVVVPSLGWAVLA